MNPWIAKSIVLIASVVLIVIRAPHGHRSRTVKVSKSRKGTLETVLLLFAWIGFFVPLIWVASPLFAFAEHPVQMIPLAAGTICLVIGLWLFYRSHADLGTNWSISLEVRENHQLITHGIYQHIRHPMYLALFLYGLGLALVIPNWVAGPVNLVAFCVLFALRIGPEEQLMVDEFGQKFEEYRAHTKRLLPGIW